MPDASGSVGSDERTEHDSDIVIVQRDRDLVETLQHELELRNQEIARLHDVVVAQARAIEQATAATPALPESGSAPLSAEGQVSGTFIVGRVETLWQRLRHLLRGGA